MPQIAIGEFTVVLQPLELEEADAGRGRMRIDKRLTGDLVGEARGQMLTATTAVDGSAAYVAVERVSGRLHGREGSFVLHHRGVMDRGRPDLSIAVVPDSGTGALAGLSGEFRIIFRDGAHAYEFEYRLPDGTC